MAIDLNSILSLLQDDGAPEHWARQAPVMGDHIRVRRLGGLYYHHGIYVSDDEVIAFAGDDDYNPIDWWDTEIRATSFEEFRQGGDVEVRQYTPAEQAQLCSVPETIAFARACLGNKKYDLLFHNCEHFANACKLGVYRNVSKFRKTNKRPSRICGGFFVYDLSGFFIPLGLSLRRCR